MDNRKFGDTGMFGPIFGKMTEPNEFGKAMQKWWDSDSCKELQKENAEAKQRAVGKYFMLSESDKLDMVQAICLYYV
jgi:hypothetical protein